MITAAVVQASIDSLKTITKVEFCVYDTEGIIVASTFTPGDISKSYVDKFSDSPADSQVINGYHLLKVHDEGELLYILVAKGSSDDAYIIAKICVSQLQALVIAYKERFDRNNFFQNLILDNLLLVDIYNRAQKLHVDINASRVVFLIESDIERDNSSMEILKGLFTQQYGDYLTAVDEKNIILIKKVDPKSTFEDFMEIARSIVDIMNTEAMVKVRVSFGTMVSELKDVSKSYKEAKLALEVGRIFYIEREIISYNKLGIGRLIYQLPDNLCRIFLEEIFKNGEGIDLDDDNLRIIDKFFENNLNVSQTAEQLYMHRNTIMYRLGKIEEMTGLNLRNFDDALTFKIALMVSNYIKHLDS
ncbi:MAG: helix-turn-helix domain-containing protein [Lachnospiraceae bacterium]|nr:helix-turn-helix domain-containing protein [Lachnospiraceae bacterium]